MTRPDRVMTCQEYLDGVSSLIDGELPVEEIEAMRRHAETCAACSTECATLLCTGAQVRATSSPAVPEGLWDRVRDAAAIAGSPLPAVSHEVLTLGEAAAYLRLTEDALAGALDEVPHFTIGRWIRFRRRSLKDWIERQERGMAPALEGRRFAAGASRRPAGTAGADVIDFHAARARMSRMGLIGDRTGMKGRVDG